VPNTKVGITRYHDFLARIPRDEVRRLEAVVFKHLKDIDPNLKLCTCGSYRRGKSDCGDIDIIITHTLDHPTEGVLPELLHRLHTAEFLTDDLTSGSYTAKEKDRETDKNGKYMGVCRLPGIDPNTGETYKYRRIDLRVYPLPEWPTALLYFTGSGHFNRSMRLWAKKNNFHLSDHEIVRRVASGMESETPIPVRTEEDVFAVLGLKYKAPHERNT
jgi:DNA polymerase lambda